MADTSGKTPANDNESRPGRMRAVVTIPKDLPRIVRELKADEKLAQGVALKHAASRKKKAK